MNDISNDSAMEPERQPVSGPSLVERVQAAIEKDGLSQNAAAKEMGFSGPALNQWLKGKYKGDNAGLDRLAGQWLESRERRQQAALMIPTAPAWFDGPTARDITITLAMAQADGDIVTITGSPGVGKTIAAAAFRDANPSVWMATMAPHSSSVVVALQEIAEAVGLKDMAHTGARTLFRAIQRRVAETHGLLIIDEAQHLNVKCFDEVRSIHDVTGIGIAFIGNETVSGRMAGGGRAGDHAQVYSRVGGRRYIPRPVRGDVRAQADAWGLDCVECLEFLEELAGKPGALRLVTKTIRRAAFHAGGVEKVTLEHLQAAWRNLGADR